MKEHFWTKESLIADINFGGLASDLAFVSVLLELVRLQNLATFVHSLCIILLILFNYISTNVPVSLLKYTKSYHYLFLP